MEVSDDGVRFYNPQYNPVQNEKDTLMIISATNIKSFGAQREQWIFQPGF